MAKNNPPKKYWEILEECAAVAKEREQSYGDVVVNMEHTARIHSEVFGYLTLPSSIIESMLAVKLGREAFKHKRDNIIDLINYYAIYLHLKDLNR